MSERKQATMQVASVNTRQVGSENKTMWELADANGSKYTTFVPAIGNAALPYVGGLALVEWTEKQNGNYTNRYLESVQPVAQEVEPREYETSTNGEGEVDWDGKERRNYRSRAWAQAISAMQHTGRSDETPRQVFERVKPLAHAIYRDIVGNFDEAPPRQMQEHISGSELRVPDDMADVPF